MRTDKITINPVKWTTPLSAAYEQGVVLQEKYDLPNLPNLDLLSFNQKGDKVATIFDSNSSYNRSYYIVKIVKLNDSSWKAIEITCLSDGEDAIDAMNIANTFLSN